MPTIKDVAKLAGVSISTVSNVMTGKKVVSQALEEKVLAAVAQLNYQANPMASGLKSRRTNMIGFIVTSFQRVFFAQILKGIQDTIESNGYQLSVFDSNESLSREKQCIRQFVSSMVDGVILLSMADCNRDTEYLKMLHDLGAPKKHIPIVSLERSLGVADCDAVLVDNFQAAMHIVNHLADCGHQKIAHITGPMSFEMCQLRSDGYRRALQDNGLPYEPMWVKKGNFSPLSGYEKMKELLQEAPEFTAVFADNDQMAIGAMKAIHEAGLQIPGDIAIAGFDNIFPSTLIQPSLTTIDIPSYQMGVVAAQRLLNRIDGKITGQGEPIMMDSHLIVRQSTDLSGDRTWDLTTW